METTIPEQHQVGDDAVGTAGPLRWRRTLSAGPPILVGERQIIPVTRTTAVSASLGGGGGLGVAVHHPAGVRVAPAGGPGEPQWVPVADMTRRLWWVLLALALGLHLLARAQKRRNRHAR